jgi:hypothetical protein
LEQDMGVVGLPNKLSLVLAKQFWCRLAFSCFCCAIHFLVFDLLWKSFCGSKCLDFH